MMHDADHPAATWSRVEDGFYVASRAGDFLGFVDRTGAASFDVHDGAGVLVAHCASLAEAIAVLDPAAQGATAADQEGDRR